MTKIIIPGDPPNGSLDLQPTIPDNTAQSDNTYTSNAQTNNFMANHKTVNWYATDEDTDDSEFKDMFGVSKKSYNAWKRATNNGTSGESFDDFTTTLSREKRIKDHWLHEANGGVPRTPAQQAAYDVENRDLTFRDSQSPNIFDDYINPAVWFGNLEKGMGEAVEQSAEEGSAMPLVKEAGKIVGEGALMGAAEMVMPAITRGGKKLVNSIAGKDVFKAGEKGVATAVEDNVAKNVDEIIPNDASQNIELTLKSFEDGSPLQKQLNKFNEINKNNLTAYVNKKTTSKQDKFIIDKVLNEQFKDAKNINYNELKSAVDKELVKLDNSNPIYRDYDEYGNNRLGFSKNSEAQIDEIVPNSETVIYHNNKELGLGAGDHFAERPLYHSRGYTIKNEPDVYYSTERQSDFFQKYKIKDKERAQRSLDRAQKELDNINNATLTDDGRYMYKTGISLPKGEHLSRLERAKRNLTSFKGELENHEQKALMFKNWEDRLLQEDMYRVAKTGTKKYRTPTSETAAKIEGYEKTETPRIKTKEEVNLEKEYNDLSSEAHKALRERMELIMYEGTSDADKLAADKLLKQAEKIKEKSITVDNKRAKLKKELDEAHGETFLEYDSEHQTILKKYNKLPKQVKKIFGKDVKIVTDSKGNTWYEIDIPEKFYGKNPGIRALQHTITTGAGLEATRRAINNNTETK